MDSVTSNSVKEEDLEGISELDISVGELKLEMLVETDGLSAMVEYVSVNGHQVVYTVTIPFDVVVAVDKNDDLTVVILAPVASTVVKVEVFTKLVVVSLVESSFMIDFMSEKLLEASVFAKEPLFFVTEAVPDNCFERDGDSLIDVELSLLEISLKPALVVEISITEM